MSKSLSDISTKKTTEQLTEHLTEYLTEYRHKAATKFYRMNKRRNK